MEYYLGKSDRHIIHQIVHNGGLILSEYENTMKSEFYTFPQRNRIIAGLSDALFVPEAGSQS
ncbi:DNA-processing protein DprA [Patescibacteria group bacterium]|nr:DNA-processing protein DprA [Patescibacteria group bacterium]MBU1758847.1 DNA-processing protein DprA [Patescibacteria group bacterium]